MAEIHKEIKASNSCFLCWEQSLGIRERESTTYLLSPFPQNIRNTHISTGNLQDSLNSDLRFGSHVIYFFRYWFCGICDDFGVRWFYFPFGRTRILSKSGWERYRLKNQSKVNCYWAFRFFSFPYLLVLHLEFGLFGWIWSFETSFVL